MKKLQNKKGFTLTEMIVVLAIIGILIALLAPNVARLIKNAQITSDNAKAKNVMNVAQAYATEAIAENATLTAAAAQGEVGTGKDKFYVLMLDTTDTNIQDFYYNGVPAADQPAFMDKTGDSYLPGNAIKGTDKVYMYVSFQGTIMGTVYTNGDDEIKAVAGTCPSTVSTTLGGLNFSTKDVMGKGFNVDDGIITP